MFKLRFVNLSTNEHDDEEELVLPAISPTDVVNLRP